MARYTIPLSERPTAQAIDNNLSQRNSEIFKEKQKWLSQRDELVQDLENDEKSAKTLIIFIGFAVLIAIIGKLIMDNNEKRFEQILKENKKKKSK